MKLKYISWIPVIILMIVIFVFSSKTAVESEESSSSITVKIIELYEKVFNIKKDIKSRNYLIPKVDFIVRKMAHATEYAVLAVCVAFHLWACGIKGGKLFLYAFAISSIYAGTDEFHQLFVEGRAGQIKDVLIDSVGALIGSSIFSVIVSKVKLKKKSLN